MSHIDDRKGVLYKTETTPGLQLKPDSQGLNSFKLKTYEDSPLLLHEMAMRNFQFPQPELRHFRFKVSSTTRFVNFAVGDIAPPLLQQLIIETGHDPMVRVMSAQMTNRNGDDIYLEVTVMPLTAGEVMHMYGSSSKYERIMAGIMARKETGYSVYRRTDQYGNDESNSNDFHEEGATGTMNDRNLYAALNPNVVAVNVQFDGNQQKYTYKALKEQGVAVDDFIVVQAQNKLVVLKVVEVKEDPDFDPGIHYKWVITRVDMTTHDAIVEREKEFIKKVREVDRNKKREELKKELTERLGAPAVRKLTADFK